MTIIDRLISATLAVALLAATAPAAATETPEPAGPTVELAAVQFDDVPPDHRFADAVAWLVAQEITTGRTPTSFDPSGEVTRGQMAAFLWRYQSSVPPQTAARFVDVPADAWNADAVSYLAEAGITQGVTSDRYGGSEPVTRQQMATFLWRLSGRPPTDAPPGFDDVAAGSTHADAIGWLAQSGVTTGVTADLYDPTGTVTRGQMAAFLWRLAGEPDLQTAGLNRVATEVEIADPDLVAAPSFDDQTGDATFQYGGEPLAVRDLVYIPPSGPFPHGTWGEVTDVSTDGTVGLTRTPLDTIWPELDVHAQLVPVETFETASVSVGGGGFSCGVNAAQVELATRISMDPDGEVGDLRLRSIARNIGEDELFFRAGVNTTLDVTVTGTGLPNTISCTADLIDMVGLKMVVPALPVILVELNPTVSATFEMTSEGAGSSFAWDRSFGVDIALELTGQGPDGDATPYVSETSQVTAEDGSRTYSLTLAVGPEVVVLPGGVVGAGVSAAVGFGAHTSTECDPNLLEHGWKWVDFTASGSVFGRAQLWTKHLSATWEPVQRTFGPYFPTSISGSDAVGPHCEPEPEPDPDPEPAPGPVSGTAGEPHMVNGALVIDRTLEPVDEWSTGSTVRDISNNDRYVAFYSHLEVDTDVPSPAGSPLSLHGRAYLYDLDTHTIRYVGDSEDLGVLAVRDDGTVVSTGENSSVVLVDPSTGVQQVLYDPASQPEWYPGVIHEVNVAGDGRTAYRRRLGDWDPVDSDRYERHGSFEVFDLDSGARLAGLDWTDIDDVHMETTSAGHHPRFSPDGRTLVYHRSDSRIGETGELEHTTGLWKLDVTTDTHTLLIDTTDAPDESLNVGSPDQVANGGNRMVFSGNSGIFLYDRDSAPGLVRVSDDDLYESGLSADGSTLAATRYDEALGVSELLVIDVDRWLAGDRNWTNVSNQYDSPWPAISAGPDVGGLNPITSDGSHLLTNSYSLWPGNYQVRIGYLPLG